MGVTEINSLAGWSVDIKAQENKHIPMMTKTPNLHYLHIMTLSCTWSINSVVVDNLRGALVFTAHVLVVCQGVLLR